MRRLKRTKPKSDNSGYFLYRKKEVFSPESIDDALHVACAVISRVDILVSWNFRHLVRRTRRALINEVNIRHGFPAIDIVSPPEI